MSKLVHFSFESGAQDTLTKGDAMYVKIDVYQDDMSSTWNASPPSALAALDLSSPATGDPFSWNVPETVLISNAEAGVTGNSSLSIEAINVFVGTDGTNVASGSLSPGCRYKNVGYTRVRYNGVDYVTGQYFQAVSGVLTYTTQGTGTVERLWNAYELVSPPWDAVAVHFRISTKSTSGGTYVTRYAGVVNPESIELEVKNAADPETWLLKFGVDDYMQLLTRRSSIEWMESNLTHANYDYTAAQTYLTFVGDFPWGGVTYPAGRYLLSELWQKYTTYDDGRWYTIYNSGGANAARYIKLTDIFQSISDFLGFEADVNNGAAWSGFHSWKFYYNSHDSTGAGGETLNAVGIDGLFVLSALFETTYNEDYGLFDDKNDISPHSWKTAGDALEVLCRICESLGCTFRSRVNSSGERYLEIIEYTKQGTTVTLSSLENVLSIRQRPNTISTTGVTVVSTGPVVGGPQASNVTIGSDGTGSLKYDCFFLSTNNLRANYDFRQKVQEGGSVGGAWITNVRMPDTDFFCSLWALTGGTGKAAANAYSICLFQPLANGTGATAPYVGAPAFGQHDTTLTPDGYVFPRRDTGLYYTYMEAPAMALAYYLYAKVSEATDPVAFARPAGDEIELEVVGVDYDTLNYPPFKLTFTLDGTVRNYLVTEVEEDVSKDVLTYKGHTREAR